MKGAFSLTQNSFSRPLKQVTLTLGICLVANLQHFHPLFHGKHGFFFARVIKDADDNFIEHPAGTFEDIYMAFGYWIKAAGANGSAHR
jgi:hypothetical protein